MSARRPGRSSVPAPLTGLDARPVRFGGCVDKAQMLHTVDEFLK